MNLLDGFAADCKTRGLAETTAISYTRHVRHFQNLLQTRGKELLQADRLDVQDYVKAKRQEGCISKTRRIQANCDISFL